jgi:hypothetical protein
VKAATGANPGPWPIIAAFKRVTISAPKTAHRRVIIHNDLGGCACGAGLRYAAMAEQSILLSQYLACRDIALALLPQRFVPTPQSYRFSVHRHVVSNTQY